MYKQYRCECKLPRMLIILLIIIYVLPLKYSMLLGTENVFRLDGKLKVWSSESNFLIYENVLQFSKNYYENG